LPIKKAVALEDMNVGAQAPNTLNKGYFDDVRRFIVDVNGETPTLEQVQVYVIKIGGYPYFSHPNPAPVQNPVYTEKNHTGDCDDKALLLYIKMNDPKARFVVGHLDLDHARRDIEPHHAWIEWKDKEDRWWFIETTVSQGYMKLLVEKPKDKWIPIFSIDRDNTYCHKPFSLKVIPDTDTKK
jgi:hypothetical protein